jgi:hypothetical protein
VSIFDEFNSEISENDLDITGVNEKYKMFEFFILKTNDVEVSYKLVEHILNVDMIYSHVIYLYETNKSIEDIHARDLYNRIMTSLIFVNFVCKQFDLAEINIDTISKNINEIFIQLKRKNVNLHLN